MLNYKRYKRVPVVQLSDRRWPDREIEKAPVWCSVDLRDGNQALIEPMLVEEKVDFFNLLLKLGFKEIEIGFPSASQLEYDFLRTLVKRNMIPEDVTIQVLVQCREHLIEKTFESIEGISNVIVHIYNSTSVLQRDVVFGKDKESIKQLAIDGTRMVKKYAKQFEGNIFLEYSPESFTGTELDYALEVCTAVQEEWGATPDNPVIINLPATVEMTTPNVYADQIEWMCRHFKNRESIIVSVHPHNDRGTAVAAAELSLLAGADRVEGTLFGNGERTGNVDILTIAYNMFSQGLNPELNLENINEIIEVYERCNKMPVGARHPYAGKLVFTAFSGSHQDAINKGVKALRERNNPFWEVPYLPIDPADVGRQYEAIVRINSQSGKGGLAFVMEQYFGYKLPKGLQAEFSKVIQILSEEQGELASDKILETFHAEYVEAQGPFAFHKCIIEDVEEEDNELSHDTKVTLHYAYQGNERVVTAKGTGPIDAVKNAIQNDCNVSAAIHNYHEHSLGSGSDARAAAYIKLENEATGKITYGVGESRNISRASIKAVFSALNRIYG